MSTDRELLELAAKAAGIVGEYSPNSGIMRPAWPWAWNPLTDDGDALRLAVKLDIPISSESVNGTTWVCRGDLQVNESHSADPYAATRRAIVRAAAEIGKHSAPSDSGREG